MQVSKSSVFFGLAIILVLVQLVQCSTLRPANILTKQQKHTTLEEPIVETLLGSIRGMTLKSREGRDYYAFYKVPYAKPPVGNLRFKV